MPGHQPVAELLQHKAAKPRHRRRGFVEVSADEIAPILRVEPRRYVRSSAQHRQPSDERVHRGSA
jgi:hypothetical protein